MRSASEGYNQRYPGDLPPRNAGMAGVGTVRPLPTPRPSQPIHPSDQGGRYPHAGASYSPVPPNGSTYAPAGMPTYAQPDDTFWSVNSLAGAGGVRTASSRPAPADPFRFSDATPRTHTPRGSLSPVSSSVPHSVRPSRLSLRELLRSARLLISKRRRATRNSISHTALPPLGHMHRSLPRLPRCRPDLLFHPRQS